MCLLVLLYNGETIGTIAASEYDRYCCESEKS